MDIGEKWYGAVCGGGVKIKIEMIGEKIQDIRTI
jgi:hypothetical protein